MTINQYESNSTDDNVSANGHENKLTSWEQCCCVMSLWAKKGRKISQSTYASLYTGKTANSFALAYNRSGNEFNWTVPYVVMRTTQRQWF